MDIMRLSRKALIVAAYVAVFWAALPAALFVVGQTLDTSLALAGAASPWGWPLIVGGLALVLWGAVALQRRGHGLPIGMLPPTQLVTSGPYGIVRHPMYLGYHVALIGAALVIGSGGCLVVAGPVFLVGWVAYALVEERTLARRFGGSYDFYREEVGLFPRPPLYRLAQALIILRVFPVAVDGRENLPSGPYVIVANHACYLDPAFLTRITPRRIRFLATADVFRSLWSGWIFRRSGAIPLRRYRADSRACRAMLRLLTNGEIIGIFPEGERSPLGTYEGTRPAVAAIVARLGVPVIPIGISGNYDAGPRWSDTLRRRPIQIQIGPAIAFDGLDAKQSIDDAILALLPRPEPIVQLAGLPRDKIYRVLWACPRCLAESSCDPNRLVCARCGARWSGTADGYLVDERGQVSTLAALGAPLFAREPLNDTVACSAQGFAERSSLGPIGPLIDLGYGTLRASPKAVSFGAVTIPMHRVRSVITERGDTLEVATDDAMWQFRVRDYSVFRLQKIVECWAMDDRRAPGKHASTTARPPAGGRPTR